MITCGCARAKHDTEPLSHFGSLAHCHPALLSTFYFAGWRPARAAMVASSPMRAVLLALVVLGAPLSGGAVRGSTGSRRPRDGVKLGSWLVKVKEEAASPSSSASPRPQRSVARVHRVRRLPGERCGRLLLLHWLLARGDSAPRAPFHAARGALARLQAEADHRRETRELMGGKPLRYTGVIFFPGGLDPAVGAGARRRRGWRRRRRGWARR